MAKVKTASLLLGVALLAVCAAAVCAARLPSDFFNDPDIFGGPDFGDASSGGFSAGLKGIRTSSLVNKGKKDAGDRAYVAIRFTVPPSEQDGFEKKWMKLDDKEEDAHVFELRKTSLDNLFYLTYGEWKSVEHFMDFLDSDHFQDFAEWVDGHGVRWQLQILKNMSEDIEEKQSEMHKQVGEMVDRRKERREKREKKHDESGGEPGGQPCWDEYIPKQYRKYIPKEYRPDPETCEPIDQDKGKHKSHKLTEDIGRGGHKGREDEKAHVLIYYIVPPGQADEFVDAWTDAAKDTIKESGNLRYHLRKVASDNTHFCVYGTWETMGDYLDHFESDHVHELKAFAEDNNIVWFVIPVEDATE